VQIVQTAVFGLIFNRFLLLQVNRIKPLLLAENISWEISIIGLSISLFTLATLVSKSIKHTSDWLLASWLLLLNVPFLHASLAHLNYHSPAFNLITNPTLNLLHGPILYLYVRLLISKKPLALSKKLPHFIPFIIFYLLFISMAHPEPMLPLPDRTDTISGPVAQHPLARLFEPLFFNFGLINALFFVGYSILTFYALRKHQQKISGVFSQNNTQLSLQWIYCLPATFCALVILNAISENLFTSANQASSLTLHMLSFVCFITVLCFFGVKQNPVFYSIKNIASNTQSIANTERDKASGSQLQNPPQDVSDLKQTESGSNDLSDEAIAEIIVKMQSYMRQEKPYLDPDFSVYSLALALNIPRRVLSQALNTGLSKNFYLYVNEYRIDEVKNLLKQSSEKQLTILEVAFQAGFKSKSSFNSLFKQYCDMTPSQYRKMIH